MMTLLYYGFLLAILVVIFPFVGVVLAVLLLFLSPIIVIEELRAHRNKTVPAQPKRYGAQFLAGFRQGLKEGRSIV